MYIGGFTFILWHLTPESTPGVGARGQNLEFFKLLFFKFFSGVDILTATDQKALIPGPKVTRRALLRYDPGGGGALAASCVPMREQNKMREGTFFKLGSAQCCHHLE